MKKFLVTLVVIAGLLGATVQPTSADYANGENCYDNTWGDVVCAEDWVAEAIWSAANYYGVDGDLLMQVAACENDYLWWPVGPYGEVGIFQFLPDTYYWLSGGYGDPASVWDAAYTAAYGFSQGWAGLWTCYWRI